MGMAWSRFGRNVPHRETFPEREPEIMSPSPREVSLALLTRDQFIPAVSVNDLETQRKLRTGEDGKLREPQKGQPFPGDPGSDPANTTGFWLGLAMMYSLFIKEHNAICDRLRIEYPHWTDEQLFQRARLVNAALIAKIHTVEWTPRASPSATPHSGSSS
jgi:hypothetical protein